MPRARRARAPWCRSESDRHDAAAQDELAARLYQHFDDLGMSPSGTETTQVIQAENKLLFTIVVAFLILMALLLAAVGGLGLATTMSINMMERVREVGVLRAIGASNASVRQIVLAEGVAMAVISWGIGMALSLFIAPALSSALGLALIKIPLTYHYSVTGRGGLVLHPARHRRGCQPGAGAQRRPPDGARGVGV